MSLGIGDNFKYQGKKPNFERDSFATKAEMKGFPEANVDEGHISFCEEDGKHYEFKAGNSVDTNTGKWREFTTNVDLSGYATKTEVQQSVANKVDKSYVDGKVDVKQDKLADGINIKTINGQPIMGKGNITIAGPDGQLDLSGYATKTEMLNNITDYNVSKHHPTEGIGGTNKFTLETAIKLIPESLRSVGIKCSFLDSADQVVSYVFKGGSFTNAEEWSNIDKNSKIDVIFEKVGHEISETSVYDTFAGLKYDGDKVISSDSTYNGIILDFDKGTYKIEGSSIMSIGLFDKQIQENSVPLQLVEKGVNFSVVTKTYVLVTINRKNSRNISVTYITGSGILKDIHLIHDCKKDIEKLSSDAYQTAIKIEGINKTSVENTLTGLRWTGVDIQAKSDFYDSVCIQLEEGAEYIIETPTSSPALSTALTFDHYPEIGDKTYIKGNRLKFVATAQEKYLLVTIKTENTKSVTIQSNKEGHSQMINKLCNRVDRLENDKYESLNNLIFTDNLNKQRRDALSNTINKLLAKTLKYAILGDSITDTHVGHGHAGGGASDAEHGYPQILHKWIKSKYGSTIQFDNHGTGGHTVQAALDVFDTYITPNNYDLVILALGTNNWNIQTPISEFEQTYRKIILKITNMKKEWFIVGIGFFDKWKQDTAHINEKEYNEVLKKLAKEYNVPYVDTYDAMRSDIQMNNRTFDDITLRSDPVHPNDAGHQIWAAEVFKIFL